MKVACVKSEALKVLATDLPSGYAKEKGRYLKTQ
jgi:hypothetical protein